MQVNEANCHSKFVVHEIMNFVANLKVHFGECAGNVNITMFAAFVTYARDQTRFSCYRNKVIVPSIQETGAKVIAVWMCDPFYAYMLPLNSAKDVHFA